LADPFENDEIDYKVVVNDEGQYSIWPEFREVPAGWSAAGPNGRRQHCLDWIEANWTDMRPKSLIEASNISKPLDGV
jgi:MbtH protein